MQHKIIAPSEIPHSKRVKIVLCQGCFDLLHVGHIKHLAAAKKYGDILVVAVTADKYVNKGPGRPYFNQDLRMEQLSALAIVDYVVLSDAVGAEHIISLVKPDFFVKGGEYENPKPDIVENMAKEREAVEKVGGKVAFTHDQIFSSSEIINKVFSPLSPELRTFIDSGLIDKHSVFDALEKIRNLKVLVVGDTIIDEYLFVKTIGMATKQSHVSARFLNNESHLGGTIATARHIAQLCDNVTLLTSLSNLDYERVKSLNPQINVRYSTIGNEETIRKTRFIDESNRILFRIDSGDDTPKSNEQFIMSNINHNLYDMIVVNDFGHGFINESCAKLLSYIPIFTCVNTQTNNMNRGFNLITKYKKANYVSLDLPEARLATGNQFSTENVVASSLSDLVPYDILSITHGKYGARIYQNNKETYVPAFSSDVVDTTGAGDAYFSITSLLAKINANPAIIGFVGNAVGSLKTRILGNRTPIDPVLLKKYMVALLK